jgi:glucokinase
MYMLREVIYVDQVPHKAHCLLAADIGGTNSNFGFFKRHNDQYILLFSLHAKSQEIINFVDLVTQVIAHARDTYAITVTHSCFAGAGIVSQERDYCKPTNLNFAIDAREIASNTALHCVTVANDFEVIGYGISKIAAQQVVPINSGTHYNHATQGIIGAGTGLGKCSLFWDKHAKRYIPQPSEGGHADFAAQEPLEYDLIEFIRHEEQKTCTISWEEVLSGMGITRMYHFFRRRNNNVVFDPVVAQNGLHPDLIFEYRDRDEHCAHTYALYQRLYARCAKNFALDILALGGLYVAGGIAAHNLALFQEPNFINEFVNCGKQQDVLRQIPITVVTDYNVSLYGAVVYMELEGLCS